MKMRQISLLGIGLGAIAALSTTPVQAEPAQTVQTISQAIPLGNGLEQQSGWYGSIHPSVVFDPSFEGESERTNINQVPAINCIDDFPPGSIFFDYIDCEARFLEASDELESFSVNLDSNTGFGLSGALGYRFNKNSRVELELGYNRNSVDSIRVGGITRNRDAEEFRQANPPFGVINPNRPLDENGFPSRFVAVDREGGSVSLPAIDQDIDGKIETWTLIASAYYDIETGSPFKPYLGGGLGIARLSASDIETEIPELYTRVDLDGSDTSFIFQLNAGTAYQIGDRGSVSLGYRLQGLPGQKFEADGIDFDSQTILTHAVEFGGQYRF